MRLSSLLVSGATLYALSSPHHGVEAVAACAECPADKTCLLDSGADAMAGGQAQLTLHFCNFNRDQTDSYELEFSTTLPLECDPSNKAMPRIASLAPEEPCAADNCIVQATLKSTLDWAIVLMNNNQVNTLNAKITSDGGQDEVVVVAIGAGIPAGAMTGGGDNDGTAPLPTVCSRSFDIKAARLSNVKECNSAQLCAGKSAENACTSPLMQGLPVDNVQCTGEDCTGAVKLSDSLACDAVSGDNDALILGVKVGNAGDSNLATIATLSEIEPALIEDVEGLAVGSSKVRIHTNAVCSGSALEVKLGDASISNVKAANGSVTVSLDGKLDASKGGEKLEVSVTQCGVDSSSFSATVSTDGADSDISDDDSSTSDGGVETVDSDAPSTQEENVKTGLPGGLYVGIAVGVIAFFGFVFECWFHKRRNGGKPSDSATPAAQSYGQAAA